MGKEVSGQSKSRRLSGSRCHFVGHCNWNNAPPLVVISGGFLLQGASTVSLDPSFTCVAIQALKKAFFGPLRLSWTIGPLP